MPVISITITASQEQVIPGLPKSISISTNEPATIFYTLDGTNPNTFSPIYISPIILSGIPTSITLKILATNGTDSSAIVTQQYTGNVSTVSTPAGARIPHSTVSNLGNAENINNQFPFGENSPTPNFTYQNPSNAGTTVYNQAQAATSTGFNASGSPAAFTNQDPSNYAFTQVYSTSNAQGEEGNHYGNLPAKVEVIGKQSPIEYSQLSSSTADKLFNPRSFVVYQDTTNEDPTNPVIINRGSFSLEPLETTRDGRILQSSGLDTPLLTGSFVRREFNERTGMMTYYYRDNAVNRWIISSTPFQPTNQNVGVLYQMVYGKNEGSGAYFKWINFIYRTLF